MTFTEVLLGGIWFRCRPRLWSIQTKQNRATVKICPSHAATGLPPQSVLSMCWTLKNRSLFTRSVPAQENLQSERRPRGPPVAATAVRRIIWHGVRLHLSPLKSKSSTEIICRVRPSLCFRENRGAGCSEAGQAGSALFSVVFGRRGVAWVLTRHGINLQEVSHVG